MSRKMMMLCPAVAFALSAAAGSLTMAKPLTAEQEAATDVRFGPGQVPWKPVLPGKLPDLDPYWDYNPDMILCAQTIIEIGTGRAHTCEGLTGPRCLAACVGTDEEAACRSACEDRGAVFCTPSKLEARRGFDDDDDDFHKLLDDHDLIDLLDDHDFDDVDTLVYVNTEFCLEADL